MLKGRAPTKAESNHMDKVAQTGCIICQMFHGVFSPGEIHHTDGKTKEGAHYRIICLCFNHHRSRVRNDNFVSRHPYKKEFENRYKPECELVSITMAKVGV